MGNAAAAPRAWGTASGFLSPLLHKPQKQEKTKRKELPTDYHVGSAFPSACTPTEEWEGLSITKANQDLLGPALSCRKRELKTKTYGNLSPGCFLFTRSAACCSCQCSLHKQTNPLAALGLYLCPIQPGQAAPPQSHIHKLCTMAAAVGNRWPKASGAEEMDLGNMQCWLDSRLHPSPVPFPFLLRLLFSPRETNATCFCSQCAGNLAGVQCHQPSRSVCQKELPSFPPEKSCYFLRLKN